MRRRPPYCDVDEPARRITAVLRDRTVVCEVPSIFGRVLSAEVRDDYIVGRTERGKVAFHATSKLSGKMPWHFMLKAFRELCVVDALADRVQFHITHHRFKNYTMSSVGAAGRILIDRQVVLKGVAYPGPHEFSPRDLGAALATCLDLTPAAALASAAPLVRALALLDRRMSDTDFLALNVPAGAHPLYAAFHRLRLSAVAPRAARP